MLWLAGQLPDDSALHASLRGGREFRPWTLANTLRAAVVNQLYAANRQRAGKKPGKALVKPPEPRRARPRAVPITRLDELRALTTVRD